MPQFLSIENGTMYMYIVSKMLDETTQHYMVRKKWTILYTRVPHMIMKWVYNITFKNYSKYSYLNEQNGNTGDPMLFKIIHCFINTQPDYYFQSTPAAE